MLAIVGAPFVARALDDDVIDEIAQTAPQRPTLQRSAAFDASIDADPVTAESVTSPESVLSEIASPAAVDSLAEPAVDPVIVLLADTYTWDESGARIAMLQQNLGLVADGVYGRATQQAHRKALDFVGLPTDILPAAPLPPGPSAAQWEALRWCESNGNYAITNPSGKYRGAYQFDRSTWNSVADRHAPHLVGVDPAAASPADQDYLALALYSERGARPWPHCGRHLS
jgi:hypothetical protein